jgi:hypothetical protein
MRAIRRQCRHRSCLSAGGASDGSAVLPPGIHEVAQFFAGLEVRDLFWLGLRPWCRFSDCVRCAACADGCGSCRSRESRSCRRSECSDDGIEDGLDNGLTVAPRQVAQFGHFLNKVSFRHGGVAPIWVSPLFTIVDAICLACKVKSFAGFLPGGRLWSPARFAPGTHLQRK